MTCHLPRFAASGLVAALLVVGVARVAAQDPVSLNPMQAVERSALKSILERPLFDPTRNLPAVAPPPPIAATAPSAPPQPPPSLHLLGVIHGRLDMAFAHRDGETATLTLRTGDHVDDWVVTVLPPVGVRLSNGGRSFDYALFASAPVAAGPLDAAPKAAGPVAGPIAALPNSGNPAGQTDAIRMPDAYPADTFKISPN